MDKIRTRNSMVPDGNRRDEISLRIELIRTIFGDFCSLNFVSEFIEITSESILKKNERRLIMN